MGSGAVSAVPDAFTRPDLTNFTRLDELDLEVTGQLFETSPGSARLPGRGTGRLVPAVRLPGSATRHRDTRAGARTTPCWSLSAAMGAPRVANDAVLAEGQRVLIAEPARLDCVKVVGADETSDCTCMSRSGRGPCEGSPPRRYPRWQTGRTARCTVQSQAAPR